MKKLFLGIMIATCCCSFDSKTMAEDNDPSTCAEIQYGQGRKVSGGCVQLDIDIHSKCIKTFKVLANYSYRGKDGDGNECGGSKDDHFVGNVYSVDKTKTLSFNVCHCLKTEQAWINDVVVKYY